MAEKPTEQVVARDFAELVTRIRNGDHEATLRFIRALSPERYDALWSCVQAAQSALEEAYA